MTPMKSIKEQQVNWSIFSNIRELGLPLKEQDYPVVVQLYDASGRMVLEARFEQPPVLLKDTCAPGTYRCVVWKNEQRLFTETIIL